MVYYYSLKDRKRDLQRLARTCLACRIGDHDHCSMVREPTRRQKWIPCQCEHVKPKNPNPSLPFEPVPRTATSQNDDDFAHRVT